MVTGTYEKLTTKLELLTSNTYSSDQNPKVDITVSVFKRIPPQIIFLILENNTLM